MTWQMGSTGVRTNKRYAVRRAVTLRAPSARKRDALMFELWSEGCRISNPDALSYSIDQEVTVDLEDGERLPGFVRSSRDGVIGVRFARALRLGELADLLETSRPPEFHAAALA